MNKISCLALIWIFCVNIPVFAATEKVALNDNKFGGITKVISYFANDNYYNKGVKKRVTYYDNRNREKVIEIYQTRDYSEKVGIYKTLIHNKKNGRTITILFTNIQAAKNGYSKLVLHLSTSNKLKKREYIFNKNSPIAMLGIYKRVIYYDSGGEITKVIHLDKVGNIAMVE